MASAARNAFQHRITDVEEIIRAHGIVTGNARGRRHEGQALTKAGIVLLAAAAEAFFEDLFNESLRLIYPNLSENQIKEIVQDTSGRLNNASVKNVNLLYLHLGMPLALDGISWRNSSNETVKRKITAMVKARNRIAHGAITQYYLANLRTWKINLDRLSEHLERKLARHIGQVVGEQPEW